MPDLKGMNALKTRSLEKIEHKMEGLDENSVRYRVLQSVKNFKTSWMDLGQALYTVWKDKLYRDWEYLTFEAYTSKEIGIRKDTAVKLLKSYYFLEKEEPQYLHKDFNETSEAAIVPSYEAINALRLAKNKKEIDEEDYTALKKNVFEKGRDIRDIKKDITALIRQREELDPAEAREKRKVATVRRIISTLKTLKNEVQASKLLPVNTIKEINSLIDRLEAEVEQKK
ncbi:MAG: hypothetical protein Q8R05_07020 [Candidatus Omnitrophota bacterium]|nr:hypothetical protein [Candidatus Omnitrophota bacterium]